MSEAHVLKRYLCFGVNGEVGNNVMYHPVHSCDNDGNGDVIVREFTIFVLFALPRPGKVEDETPTPKILSLHRVPSDR